MENALDKGNIDNTFNYQAMKTSNQDCTRPCLVQILKWKLKKGRKYERLNESETEISFNTRHETHGSNAGNYKDSFTSINGDVQSNPEGRRAAICDEIERRTLDGNGASLREFRKLLVTHLMLRELQLV